VREHVFAGGYPRQEQDHLCLLLWYTLAFCQTPIQGSPLTWSACLDSFLYIGLATGDVCMYQVKPKDPKEVSEKLGERALGFAARG
jgi:hypothetical protein